MPKRFTRLTLALLLSIAGAVGANAQEEQEPKAEKAAHDVQRDVPKDYRLPDGEVYRSDTLGSSFLTEWMFINVGGVRYEFWGARITGLDDSSPLHALGVRNGDVITRLDGIRISRRMYKRDGAWQLPEMERHYGRTEVRYIRSGTNRVRIGDIMLDGGGPNGGAVPP